MLVRKPALKVAIMANDLWQTGFNIGLTVTKFITAAKQTKTKKTSDACK
jgi:hypothetical protein